MLLPAEAKQEFIQPVMTLPALVPFDVIQFIQKLRLIKGLNKWNLNFNLGAIKWQSNNRRSR